MKSLKIESLDFAYLKNKNILHDINFSVNGGEIISILGRNGCGKTTIMKNLIKVLTPTKGGVYLNEKKTSEIKAIEVAQNISYVGQTIEKEKLTVFDYILLGRRPYIKYRASKNDYNIVKDIMGELELDYISNSFINEISGGQLQKISIARSLVQQPNFICLDEPTSNLDLKNQLGVLNTITSYAKKNNIGVIMVMHDINLSIKYSTKFLLVKNGRVFSFGGIDTINEKNIHSVFSVHVEIIKTDNFTFVYPR